MDKFNMLGILESFSRQCKDAVNLAKRIKIKGKFENIVVCGMGGSGIGGDLIAPFVKKIPVYVNKDYGLPGFVNRKSLVFVVSYSGDTEETLSAYAEAKKRKATVVVITGGGKLAEKEKKAIIIPSEIPQPREAIGYLFLSILVILSNTRIISNQDNTIREAIRLLVPKLCSKEGFMLAKKLKDKIPVFYSSGDLKGVCYRIKTQINENAKQPAFCSVFPEMNHNEINGFKKNAKKLYAVLIRDKKDSLIIKRRMDISKKIIKEKTKITELHVKGKSLLARMLWTIYVGDYTSYYLALMNKEDPTSIPVIKELKGKLKK